MEEKSKIQSADQVVKEIKRPTRRTLVTMQKQTI
jgi:hypothetical protein